MAIEVTANNPLGLTVAGPGYGNPNSFLYQGQSGVITSGAGYTFATFPSQQAGIAAGIQYIINAINNGFNTVSQLVDRFSPADLSAFEQTTGLSPNSPLNAANAGLYAAGIAAGEGTLSAFGGVGAFTGGQQVNTGNTGIQIPDAIGNTLAPFSDPFGLFGPSTLFSPNNAQPSAVNGPGGIIGAGQQGVQATGNIAGAVAYGVGSAVKPLTDWLTGLTSGSTVTRVAIGIVAVILLLAGIFFLANNKTITLNAPNLARAGA